MGTIGWTAHLGNWRLERPPMVGAKEVTCPCGALYWKHDGWRHWLHVEGRGWV